MPAHHQLLKVSRAPVGLHPEVTDDHRTFSDGRVHAQNRTTPAPYGLPRTMALAALRSAHDPGAPAEVGPADQPVLSQGPACQLRQARPDPLARPDQHRRGDPADWEVALLGREPVAGSSPLDPFPEVVGITVHLTFAERAYALRGGIGSVGPRSSWEDCTSSPAPTRSPRTPMRSRRRGRAVLAANPPRRGGGDAPRGLPGDYRRPYRDDPPPRRDLLPRRGFLTTTSLIATSGCHNRCGFCYLATDGLSMPYQVRDVEQVVEEFRGDGQPYARLRRQ